MASVFTAQASKGLIGISALAAGVVSLAAVMTSFSPVSPVNADAPLALMRVAQAIKGDRLHSVEVDLACGGQAWGAESEACVKQIVKVAGETGKGAIRMIPMPGPSANKADL